MALAANVMHPVLANNSASDGSEKYPYPTRTVGTDGPPFESESISAAWEQDTQYTGVAHAVPSDAVESGARGNDLLAEQPTDANRVGADLLGCNVVHVLLGARDIAPVPSGRVVVDRHQHVGAESRVP